MQSGISVTVIQKLSPFNNNASDNPVVGIVAFQRDNTKYSEVAHQLIAFMETAKKRDGQILKSYLIVGHECLVFKICPGSQRVDVSRTHGLILNDTNTGFLTTEMCRLARDHWNWD